VAPLAAAVRNAIDFEQLRRSADTCPLTGLGNRRAFSHALDRELARAAGERRPVAVLAVDLDGFKQVNDWLGHAAGDAVLRWVADILRASTRPCDACARVGGDEFLVLMPGADASRGAVIGERIVRRLRGAEALAVSASIGAVAAPRWAYDGATLLAAADRAMYLAKRAGRGRVVALPGPEPDAPV
jgi:diguanylate cyclase (GGDEF)-like protein